MTPTSGGRSGRRPAVRGDGVCSLHYQVSGAGPPVVLLHGLFQLGAHWTHRRYTPALTDRFTVVEVDLLGHGASDAPRDPGEYRLERQAAAVAAVLDDLGTAKATVWGYSLGGWLACGLAAHHPERLASVVIGGWSPSGGIESAYAHASRIHGLPAGTDWYALLVRMAQAAPEIAAAIRVGDHDAFRRSHAAAEGWAGLDAPLLAAGVPLLLYCGDADPYHDDMEALAVRAAARFVTVRDADHGRVWARSAQVLPYVRPFLEQTAGG